MKLLIERRVIRDVDHERRRVSLSQVLREQKHAWHGVKLNQPDWSPFSHSFAISVELKSEGVYGCTSSSMHIGSLSSLSFRSLNGR